MVDRLTSWLPFYSNPHIPDAPPGFENTGNHCCFIATMQLFHHTPALQSALKKIHALNPVVAAYQSGTSVAKLNFETARKGVDIHEINHFRNQEDPAAYMRILLEKAKKTLSISRDTLTSEGNKIRSTQDKEAMLSLIPKSRLDFNALLTRYFFEPMEGFEYDKAQDRFVETGAKTNACIKKTSTFSGAPPEHLLIQIQRFGYHGKNSDLFFIRCIRAFCQFIGECLHLAQPNPLGEFKIRDAIEAPFQLEMKKEWFKKQKTNVNYTCCAFLNHRGDRIRFGHYVAYVKCKDSWYECNDAKVRKITVQQAQNAMCNSYILSYTKVSPTQI